MKALFKKAAVVLLVLMTVFAVLTAFGSEREKVSAAGTAQDVIEDLYGTKLESARIRRRLRSDLKEKN